MVSACPSADEVRRISALSDPVLRNLRITLAYSRLSEALAGLLGAGTNWCTLATWASRQAGESIRGEDTLRVLERHLKAGPDFLHPVQSLWRVVLRSGVFQPETRLGRLVKEIHSPFDVFEQVSAAVARGNLKVFEEIGLIFARYVDSAAAGDVGGLLDQMHPGPPPDGQQYLRQALSHYQTARAEPDARRRAQLRLLGNLEIGFHEQMRLQGEIVSALEAPVTVAAALPQPPVLRQLGRRYHRFAVSLTRQVTTECLMEMKLPGRIVLGLGRDLEVPVPSSVRKPDLPELVEFLARLEPASHRIGADDWGNFGQRMNYIAHVFWSFHEYTELFQLPFTSYQSRLIEGGFVPDGDL